MNQNAITITMGEMVITIPFPTSGQPVQSVDLSNFYTKAEIDQIKQGLTQQIEDKVSYENPQTNATDTINESDK